MRRVIASAAQRDAPDEVRDDLRTARPSQVVSVFGRPRRDMTTVILDTNIYDELKADTDTCSLVAELVAAGHLRVIATPKVRDELAAGPFGGVPDWFVVEGVIESVAVLDHWRLGEAALGTGEVFTAHRGKSNKAADAIVADSADAYADLFVSQDRRCRDRLAAISSRCAALDFAAFRAWVRGRA